MLTTDDHDVLLPGLTHLLWMKPSPSATVLEFFYPQGWAFDYEFIARGLGIAHFGFWNDRCVSSSPCRTSRRELTDLAPFLALAGP